jgi:uncharacterized paraquat-inducible protein A
MADVGRYLSRTPNARPELTRCPGCQRQNMPATMIRCGRCWTALDAKQREALLAERAARAAPAARPVP